MAFTVEPTMSMSDDIFPRTPSRAFVQTQWADGWAFAVLGFGSAARMLTEQRASMHGTVDQIGIAVFYLQRHRVELVMKQALVDLGEDRGAVAKLNHNLDAIWRRLGEVVSAIDSKHWRRLDGDFRDFVSTIHRADEGSFAHRYPIDRRGADVKREEFIDLDTLENYAAGFEGGIWAYTDWLSKSRQAAREHEAEMAWEYEGGY